MIIPGGHAPDKMRMDKDLVRFVHDMDTAGKPVGAICHAGWMLVSAKVLPGAQRHFLLLHSGRHGSGRCDLVGRGGGRRP